MRSFLVLFLACLLLFVIYYPVSADDFSSTNFKVKDPVIKPGAGFGTSPGFQLWSSIGQEGIGLSSGGAFGLKGGFLYFPEPSTVATSPAPGPIITPGAVFGAISKIFPFLRPQKPEGGPICDFNGDEECNIIDLSILIYYYGRSGEGIEPFDLSVNGVVDFPDISILFYYWTG